MSTYYSREDADRLRALHRLKVFLDLEDPEDPKNQEILRNRRVVMSIDGGGFFIFWSLQMLKDMEEIAQYPGYKLFDLIGGTSSGAIASLLLAQGRTAREVEEFWLQHAPTMYPFRNPLTELIIKSARTLGLQQMSYWSWVLMLNLFPPLHSKTNFRALCKETFGDKTLRDIADERNCGVFMFSRNVSTSQIISMGAFKRPFSGPDNAYANVLARTAVEASSSPPMVTQPLGRFVDAGYGPENNPEMKVISTLLAWFAEQGIGAQNLLSEQMNMNDGASVLLHKLSEIKPGKKYTFQFSEDEVRKVFYTKQKIQAYNRKFQDTMTLHKAICIFSMGTGVWPLVRMAERVAQDAPFTNGFWLFWLLYIYDVESSNLQSNFLAQEPIFPWLDYRRFQMTYNKKIINERLGNRDLPPIVGLDAKCTHDLTEQDLMYMQSGLSHDFIPVYEQLGKATVEYIHRYQPAPYSTSLGANLMNAGHELSEELSRLQDPAWIDSQPTGQASPIQPPPSWYFLDQYS